MGQGNQSTESCTLHALQYLSFDKCVLGFYNQAIPMRTIHKMRKEAADDKTAPSNLDKETYFPFSHSFHYSPHSPSFLLTHT